MNSIKLIVLIFLSLCLTACTFAPLVKAPVKESARVGIIVGSMNEHMTHRHIGTTIFNNFENDYPFGTNLKEYFEQYASDYLTSLNHVPVVINLDEESFVEFEEGVVLKGVKSELKLSDSASDRINGLHDSDNLDLIVILKGEEGLLYLPPDSHFSAGNYGLFTRSIFGSKIYMVYSFFRGKALTLSPITVNAYGWQYDNPMITDFQQSDDIKVISETQMNQLEKLIVDRSNVFIEAIIDSALNNGEVPVVEGVHLL